MRSGLPSSRRRLSASSRASCERKYATSRSRYARRDSGRAERIDLQLHARDAEQAPQPRGHRDDLRIDIGPGEADGFDVELMELAIAPLLRLLVPEHRPDAPELVTRAAQHAVRDHGAHDAGGGFGPQRETVAALILEGVHLLLDHVGELADGALEEPRLLDDGHAHFLKAIRADELAHRAFEELPRADVGGQHVVHAANGLDDLSQTQSPSTCCTRANDAPGAVDDELRAIVAHDIRRHGGGLAIHVERDAWRVTKRDAQRRRARKRALRCPRNRCRRTAARRSRRTLPPSCPPRNAA